MSKNLTRKGLALGAAVALGSTLFAGAPAFAAAGLVVAPSTGTGYTVLSSDSFTVKVYGNAEYTLSTASNIFWKVTRPSATQAVTGYTQSNSASNTPTAASTSTIDYLDAAPTAIADGATTLTINPAISTSVSADFVVQAYVEADATAGLTAGDTVLSTPVTVKFVAGASLTSTVALDAVAAGQAITGSVKYSSTDFNYTQTTLAKTEIILLENGTANATIAAVDNVSEANDSLEFSRASGSPVTVDAGDSIGVKTRVSGYDSDTTYTNSAVVYSSASAAGTADNEDTTVVSGDNVFDGTTRDDTGEDVDIRKGTLSFGYRVDFTKGTPKVAVAAGQPVTITVTEIGTTIATNDVIRVNGKKLTGAAGTQAAVVLNTVTDAKGGVDVAVTSDLGQLDDNITIAVASNNNTSTYNFKWVAAALTSIAELNEPIGSTTRTVVRSSSTTLQYGIYDQFGKVWSRDLTAYRVSLASSGGSASINQLAYFTNGIASATVVDNSTGAGEVVVTATLQDSVSAGAYGTTNSASLTKASNFNVVATASAAASITLDAAVLKNTTGTSVSTAAGVASTEVARSTVTLKAIDRRANTNAQASLAVPSDEGARVSGTVKNTDGSASAGVPVTISGTGLFFSTDAAGSTYVSADKITVNSGQNGTYSVFVFSNKGGSFTTTVAAGSVTKTQALKFTAAAATSGTTLTITSPTNVLPGRAFDVTVLLTDKFGAPVTTSGSSDIDVTLTGVGYATTIADDTDVDGKITFKVILGATEVGTVTITAKYDADGDATAYAAVTTTKQVEVSTSLPSTTTAAVAGSAKRFFVSVSGNSTAKNVVVKVAGKTFKTLKGSTAKKTYVVAAPKGSHKVTVYVGGKLVATKTISVK
jgi:hypothetical protein